jgi:Rv0078B-related antitoxin
MGRPAVQASGSRAGRPRLPAERRICFSPRYNSRMLPTPSVADAFRATLDLFEVGLRLMHQNLRRSDPGATEEEIGRRLDEWLHSRPGAESGDCPGRPLDVDGRLG